jgi:TRAP-type C4-dicarboxylate transport system permease small subunit
MIKLLNRLLTFEKLLCAFLMLVIFLLVLLDICSREVLKNSLPWAQKLAVYCMIWAGFIGASLVSAKNAHLRPEIADKLWSKFFGEQGLLYFFRAQNLVLCLFCLTLGYYSVLYIQESYEFAEKNIVLDISTWILQLAMPYTFLSMFVRHLYFVINPKYALSFEKELI